MSQFLPEEFEKKRNLRIPERGPADFLSGEEREFMQRLLGFPEDFPPKFKSWLIDNEAVNGAQIPASRIVGLPEP